MQSYHVVQDMNTYKNSDLIRLYKSMQMTVHPRDLKTQSNTSAVTSLQFLSQS